MNLYNSYPNFISSAHAIHDTYPQLSKMELYDDVTEWISMFGRTETFSKAVLRNVQQNTYSFKDEKGNLIDCKIIHQKLQSLAKDINKIINYAFDLLIRKPHLDIEVKWGVLRSIKKECAKLQIQADKMILKSVQYDVANGVLLLLAAKFDVNSPLNSIPKDLINIFATTLVEVKLDQAIKDSRGI